MRFLILAALVAVPLAEIAVFVEVGDRIGLWPTLAAVLATAAVGVALVARQGLGILERARAALERREMPADELFHGACVLAAGALLLVPGFLTDALGFLLLVPPLRAALARLARRRAAPGGAGDGAGIVIDADYHEVEPDEEEEEPPAPARRLPERRQ